MIGPYKKEQWSLACAELVYISGSPPLAPVFTALDAQLMELNLTLNQWVWVDGLSR